MNLARLILVGALLLVLAPREALAVRPFVTDDARIIDKGQIEMETWPELVLRGREATPGYHLMAGVSVSEWLEIIVGGGIGLDPGQRLAVSNPVFQPKFLIWKAEEDGFPGLSLATGLTLPFGRGTLFDDATGFYLIAPLTSRLMNDWLLVHVNLGATFARVPGQPVFSRPYWGVGFDVGLLTPELRLIGEAYAGDPFEALGPEYAFQWGSRWLVSDYVNLDLTFGAQPDLERGQGRWEVWGQLGVRLLFDTFRPRGKPGDPMGATGMIRPPHRW
jgi:hypothetical protein